MAGLSAEQVRHLLDRPAASQPTVVRLDRLGLDAGPPTPYRHHLSSVSGLEYNRIHSYSPKAHVFTWNTRIHF